MVTESLYFAFCFLWDNTKKEIGWVKTSITPGFALIKCSYKADVNENKHDVKDWF